MKEFLKNNSYPIAVFAATRLFLVLIGVLGFLAFPLNEDGDYWRMSPDNLIMDIFSRWDSGWYANIVEHGYTFNPNEPNTTAFFPLYPVLVWIAEHFVGDILTAGLIVSNLSFLLACIYFYRVSLVLTEDEAASKRAVNYLCVFPTAFFFSSFYTESSFLLLAVSSYFYALKRNWPHSVGMFFNGSLVRLVSISVLVSGREGFIYVSFCWFFNMPDFEI